MVKIHGKEYVEVHERIAHLRKTYVDAQLITDIISCDNGVCVMKATLMINDKIVSIGHAYEKEGSTTVNKTSYIENCETSAVGRCLGNFGIGINSSVASADEVANAVIQQSSPTPKETPKPDANKLQIGKDQIHDLLKNYTAEQKKDILKKATFSNYKGKDSWVDDVNNLTKNGFEPTEKQLYFYFKKIQEELLNMADKPGSDVNQVGEILQEVLP